MDGYNSLYEIEFMAGLSPIAFVSGPFMAGDGNFHDVTLSAVGTSGANVSIVLTNNAPGTTLFDNVRLFDTPAIRTLIPKANDWGGLGTVAVR